MKTILAILLLAALAVGCVTVPDKTAYKALEGSRIIVENATMAFGDYCRAMELKGKPVPQDRIDKAREVFGKWKQASLGAGRALERYIAAKNSGNDQAIASAQATLDTALTVLSASQSEYVSATVTP